MNCLNLAKRLALKNKSHIALAPVKIKTIEEIDKFEFQDSNIINPYEDLFFIDEEEEKEFIYRYIPPISYIFIDPVYKKYFYRFLKDRKLDNVLDYIDFVNQYRKTYPKTPEQQVKDHKKIMEKLVSLPSRFIKVVTSTMDENINISNNYLDNFINIIVDNLNEKEYNSFISSDYFTEWLLKYKNIK